ncbi:kinase-like domain-containing protein [Fusarium flagelliforme]|uniref:kinase-like domain-containing protein n=1 Tax=Fusarium flagelliforme TaxID=2675880 RepID=UPI001E8E74AB|nr:kinase-like domain-containing protein [Fusarium flagelliforme]KAH7191806.1 kinase-like domain-containing protein [Fusarium flagelliforme]
MSANSKRVMSLSSLPSGPNVVFHESSYFSRNRGQPFPALSEIRTEGAHQHSASYHDKTDPQPVLFESLGLLVKYGKGRVQFAKGQCLWALKHLVPEVPVPEIYGWATEGDFVILYMELVKGVTVEKRWPSMTDEERAGLWKGVRDVVDNLRKLSQEPNEHFIGQIDRGRIYDHALDNSHTPRLGPFANVKEFHDWLSRAIRMGAKVHWPGLKPEEHRDGYRHLVPDNAAIVFTHADLHPTNVMVGAENPSKIAAVIDWGQSGWWPDYWEFYKAEWTSEIRSDWHQHLLKYLEEPDQVTLDAINDYVRALGN